MAQSNGYNQNQSRGFYGNILKASGSFPIDFVGTRMTSKETEILIKEKILEAEGIEGVWDVQILASYSRNYKSNVLSAILIMDGNSPDVKSVGGNADFISAVSNSGGVNFSNRMKKLMGLIMNPKVLPEIAYVNMGQGKKNKQRVVLIPLDIGAVISSLLDIDDKTYSLLVSNVRQIKDKNSNEELVVFTAIKSLKKDKNKKSKVSNSKELSDVVKKFAQLKIR